MIRKIEFDNFYSFKNKQTINFTTSKKRGDIYYNSFDDTQITKVMGIIGPNNSGKTNVMKLFGFLKYIVTVPVRDDSDEYDTAFKAYAFGNDKPTKIFVEFETDTKLCEYSLELSQTEIFKESLKVKDLKKRARYATVFTRDNAKDIVLNPKVITGVTRKRLSSLRKDVSLVAFLKANYEECVINEVVNYFEELYLNVNEAGLIFTPEDRLARVADVYSKIPEVKEKMEEIIRGFDLDIEGFSINKDQNEIKIEARHKIGKMEYTLPIFYESRGTKALFVDLLQIILCTDLEGKLLVIDEIEMGLHPEAVSKVVQFIIDQFEDHKKQFIFASHSFDFLKKFDAQQVYLVDKDINASGLYRLDELDIRPDENFYAKYMSGRYGAYPKITI